MAAATAATMFWLTQQRALQKHTLEPACGYRSQMAQDILLSVMNKSPIMNNSRKQTHQLLSNHLHLWLLNPGPERHSSRLWQTSPRSPPDVPSFRSSYGCMIPIEHLILWRSWWKSREYLVVLLVARGCNRPTLRHWGTCRRSWMLLSLQQYQTWPWDTLGQWSEEWMGLSHW